MSWVAKRQTARLEDIAYCLLGIFDVSMPLVYGEGVKAFTRLQLEIMKTSADHSIFAWTSSTGGALESGLLAASPSNFRSSDEIVTIPEEKYTLLDPTRKRHTSYEMTNRGLRSKLFPDLFAWKRSRGNG
jgi:hypothetical protein